VSLDLLFCLFDHITEYFINLIELLNEYIIVGALCLVHNRRSLKGWGHTVFHVWTAGLQVAIIRSGAVAWGVTAAPHAR
jgi:hypothetical protein